MSTVDAPMAYEDQVFEDTMIDTDEDISILDPRLKDKFRSIIRFGILGEIWAMVMMIACVNVLYGYAWNPVPYLRNNMKIAIVNNDPTGIIGMVFSSVIANAHDYGINYKFDDLDSSYSFDKLKDLVENGDYWAAVYLNEGSSYNMIAAALSMTADAGSYDSSTVISFAFDQGRAGPSYQVALGAVGNTVATIVNIGTKTALARYFSSKGYNTSSVISSVLANPVGVTTETLNPVKLYGVQSALGNGLMQVYLISLILTIAVIKMHTELEGRGIKKSHLAYATLIHRLLSSLILALWPPIVLVMLGAWPEVIDSEKFLKWWAFLWLSITAFNVINHHLYKTVSVTIGFLVGLFMLMLQVSASSGSIPFEGMPLFYKIGYGLPFTNVVQGSRAILLGSNTNTLSRNIGILFIWVVCLAVTTVYYCLTFLNHTKTAIKYHLFPEPEDEEAVARQDKRDSLAQNEADGEPTAAAQDGACDRVHNFSSIPVDREAGEETEDPPLDETPVTVPMPVAKPSSPEASLKHRDTVSENSDADLAGLVKGGGGGGEGGPLVIATTNPHSNPDPTLLRPIVEAPDTLSIWDPSVRAILMKAVIIKGIVIEIVAIIFFLIILLITYGNVWDPTKYENNINIAVLNLDGTSSSSSSPSSPVIGASFETALAAFRQVAPYNFNIEVLDSSSDSYDTVQHKVSRGHYWAGLVIGEDSSTNLASVLYNTSASAASSYSTGTAAITYFIDTGRGGNYIAGLLKIWGTAFSSIYNYVVSSTLTIESQYGKLTFSDLNGYALLNPVRQNLIDLHPLPTTGMDGAISGGAVVLYLGMIAHVNVIFAAHRPLEEMRVKYEHRILAQMAHFLLGTFLLAVWPAIAVLWYGSADLTAPRFFNLWAMFALGMTSMGSLIVLNYHVFGKDYGGVANVIVFSLNQASATVSMPFELQHPFWRIGMGLPYYQIITCLRAILYGSEALPFRRAIGVSFAWIGFVGICSIRLMLRRKRVTNITQSVKGRMSGKERSSLKNNVSSKQRVGDASAPAPAPPANDNCGPVVVGIGDKDLLDLEANAAADEDQRFETTDLAT